VSTDQQTQQAPPPSGAPTRRPGDLTARELGRFLWRQLTSMRTALVLLLLLALAAVPGSVIPQESVDSFAARQWKDQHTTLAPIYERLGLFDVYGSVWFAAVYVLLMISLVGCILPRTKHYWRAARAVPPRAPRHLTRLPDHTTYAVGASPEQVLEAARAELRRRRYRLRPTDPGDPTSVAAERGYLREAGNLLFHLSVIVVLVGFAMGGMLGYKGGVIVLEGSSFSNNLTQYDDFVPGSFYDADDMEPFSFDVDSFDVEWLTEGAGQGMARAFDAGLTYRTAPGAPERTYDLRVNHPLKIGDSEIFLVGHGYAPVITVRDGNGDIAWSGPAVFLPQDPTFFSFGVVKALPAKPEPIGLEGFFYPFFASIDGDPFNVMGDDKNPVISMNVYVGDLGLEDGRSQSAYILEKDDATQLKNDEGRPLRLDLGVGDTADLPDGLGSVTFESVTPWVRVQVSQTPGKRIALGGVVLALIGLCGSLFIRPRRVFLRAVPAPDGSGTLVELAALDRSGGGDTAAVVDDLRLAIVEALPHPQEDPR
jgi:cytochrome c biogenesis protein